MASVLAGCTGKFEEYNKSPFEPSEQEMGASLLGTYIMNMQQMLVQGQQNNSQMIDQMIGSEYGGYTCCINPWNGTNFYTYNPQANWLGYTFDTMMPQIFTNYFSVKRLTEGEGPVYAWAQILKVYGAYLLNGIYGPIAYTKVDGENMAVEYDSEEVLFNALFEDLDEGINVLSAVVLNGESLDTFKEFDYVYAGSASKWVKFANTLKLRMAMRISNAAPELARQKAEEAVSSALGVMTVAADAAWSTYNDGQNPYYRAESSWNDLRLSANVGSYLGGYADPRLSVYANPAEYTEDAGVVGVRSGVDQTQYTHSTYQYYSKTNIGAGDPLLVMPASEAYFLRAEGVLKGWNMGGTAKELYEQGVKTSMDERGVSLGDYLSSEAVPADYVDLAFGDDIAAVSAVTPKYDEAAGTEENLERILVQKWIASFPNGWERWGDFRRTGYPKMFPVVDNKNSDGVTSEKGMRRVPYSEKEYQTNNANVRAAVDNFLGGVDAGTTDLWWAKKN